ncbi:MAG TPA: diguanylate cyclase [Rhodanobacteraceae bacterium]|nr:diguanylate cyclase [Rhodanobacteraceae bacterium]
MTRCLPALLLLLLIAPCAAGARLPALQGSLAVAGPGAADSVPPAAAFVPFDTSKRLNVPRVHGSAWVRLTPADGAWPEGPLVLSLQGAVGSVRLLADHDAPQTAALEDERATVLHGSGGLAFLLPATLSPQAPLLLHFQTYPWYSAAVVFEVQPLWAFAQTSSRWLAFASACFTCMLLLAFLAALVAAAMRDMIYVYYAAFTTTLMASQALKTGYVYHPLQLHFHAFAPQAALFIAAGLSAIFMMLFLARFLDMQRLAPPLHKVTAAIGITGGVLVALTALPLEPLQALTRLTVDPLLAALAASALLLSIFMLIRGSRYALVVLVAWTPLIACVIGTALQRHGHLLGWTWLSDATMGAAALQTLVLSLGVFDRMRRLRSQRDQARVEADTDPLTGAISRRVWARRTEALVQAAQSNGQPLSVLFIDLDHFKPLNDRYGHQVGDAALVALVTHLRGELRTGDLLGRYGGEEFVVSLPGCDADRARRMGERLRRCIERLHWRPAPGAPPITISIGCADMRRGEALDSLITRADRAMYEAKSAGRNRVVHALAIVAVGGTTL